MNNATKLAAMATRDAELIAAMTNDAELYRIKEEPESPTGMKAVNPFVLYKGHTKVGAFKTRELAEAAKK